MAYLSSNVFPDVIVSNKNPDADLNLDESLLFVNDTIKNIQETNDQLLKVLEHEVKEQDKLKKVLKIK